jgi:uncharacterized protein YnzC (UPF0291/DUF896 family)
MAWRNNGANENKISACGENGENHRQQWRHQYRKIMQRNINESVSKIAKICENVGNG